MISNLLFWVDNYYYIKNSTLKLIFCIYSVISQAFNQGHTVNLTMTKSTIGIGSANDKSCAINPIVNKIDQKLTEPVAKAA